MISHSQRSAKCQQWLHKTHQFIIVVQAFSLSKRGRPLSKTVRRLHTRINQTTVCCQLNINPKFLTSVITNNGWEKTNHTWWFKLKYKHINPLKFAYTRNKIRWWGRRWHLLFGVIIIFGEQYKLIIIIIIIIRDLFSSWLKIEIQQK